MNVGKVAVDIVIHFCAPVDEIDLVFDREMLELCDLNLLLLLLLFLRSFVTCSLFKVLWLEMYVGLVRCCSCQACCFGCDLGLWFFP